MLLYIIEQNYPPPPRKEKKKKVIKTNLSEFIHEFEVLQSSTEMGNLSASKTGKIVTWIFGVSEERN